MSGDGGCASLTKALSFFAVEADMGPIEVGHEVNLEQ
jgi:hypothetical protein